VALDLVAGLGPIRLGVRDLPAPAAQPSIEDRVLGALVVGRPQRTEQLRSLLGVRKQSLVDVLRLLTDTGKVRRTKEGWVQGASAGGVPKAGSL
jgi:hypothetical protein